MLFCFFALACLHCWLELLYHCIPIQVLEIPPSMGILKHKDTGWRLHLVFLLRSGIETVPSMISATGDLIILPLLLIRAMFTVFYLDTSTLTLSHFILRAAMNPISGVYSNSPGEISMEVICILNLYPEPPVCIYLLLCQLFFCY